MKKSVIMKAGVVALVAVFLCGCQMGPSDQKLINTTTGNWKEALIAQDLDKIMETFSEDFESMEGGDKEEAREYLGGVFDEGVVDNAEVDLENAETTIEGDKAKVSGVELTLDSGPIMLDFTLQKEKGSWLIVGVETDG